MVDLETLATSPNSLVLTIAGIRFNYTKDYRSVDSPYDLDYFYCRVDPDSQGDREIHNDTLEWWNKQSEDVKIEAFSPEDRLSLSDAMTAFNHWARNADRYWANGSAFDFPILDTCNKSLNFVSPWNYWQAMDARTVYKMVPEHYQPKQMHHHALYDCLTQIQRLTDCLSKLKVKY